MLRKPANECSDAEIAAWIKGLGCDCQAAYSRFVQARNLNPGIDAKEFFAIYDTVAPADWPNEVSNQSEFVATHRDLLTGQRVEIKDSRVGHSMRWECGMVGGESGALDTDRYVQVE